MAWYSTRPGATAYGFTLGILCLDCDQPFVPGDVGNASTWPWPVLYRRIPGCTVARLIHRGDPALAGDVVAAAKGLGGEGVKAITSNCGFLARFQAATAAAVRVPVALSALSQVPFLTSATGGRDVAVVTASAGSLDTEVLRAAGIGPHDPVAVYGLDHEPAFAEPFLADRGTVDTDALAAAVHGLGRHIGEAHPDLGAVVLECAVLPPYAHVFEAAAGVPVYDGVTLGHALVAGIGRTPPAGSY